MVVFIHVPFWGKTGAVIESLARFAVPLFFVSSGYFSYRLPAEKFKKRIVRILSLYAVAAPIFLLAKCAEFLVFGNSHELFQFLATYLDLNTLIKLFVFNEPVSSLHLWFLLALVYVYITFHFAAKVGVREKVVFIPCFVLLFLRLLLDEVFGAFGIVVPAFLYRNFLLTGIPFFGMGMLAKKYEESIRGFSNLSVIISLIIGAAATLFSRFMFERCELYLGSLLLLYAFVVISIKYSHLTYHRSLTVLASCSTYIYIVHALLSPFLRKLYSIAHLDFESPILRMIHPIVVCIISTALALTVRSLTHRKHS
jgi:surface polysaccharide O-acyltransferase-like enzyme